MKIVSTAPESELPSLPPRGYGDGYDWMGEVQSETPWAVIPSWGLDGWDAGSWPYVQILTCQRVMPVEQRQPKRNPLCVHCRLPLHAARPAVRFASGYERSALWATDRDGSGCPSSGELHRPQMRTKIYGAASYCEGDVDVWAFETHDERIDALDALIQFYWRLDSDFTADGMVPIGPLAAKWFGPYSLERAGREEPLVMVEERAP